MENMTYHQSFARLIPSKRGLQGIIDMHLYYNNRKIPPHESVRLGHTAASLEY